MTSPRFELGHCLPLSLSLYIYEIILHFYEMVANLCTKWVYVQEQVKWADRLKKAFMLLQQWLGVFLPHRQFVIQVIATQCVITLNETCQDGVYAWVLCVSKQSQRKLAIQEGRSNWRVYQEHFLLGVSRPMIPPHRYHAPETKT